MDTYTHTYTEDNYSNPRCACAPKVNNVQLPVERDAGQTPLNRDCPAEMGTVGNSAIYNSSDH